MPIFRRSQDPAYGTPMRGGLPVGRLAIGAVIALVAIIGYYSNTSVNSVTGRKQHIGITPQQEVALGLQSAPEMARQFGGLSNDAKGTALVKGVGQKLVGSLPADVPQYPYEYHLLADDRTVNAFALPGGQIFITEALLTRLTTEGQLAGVLGHETGHVLARHSAEQMAKTEFAQRLVTAAGAASDPNHAYSTQQIASMVGEFALLKYSRNDELEADKLGVRFMAAAGYDPRTMIGVMEVLEKASGGGGSPDFVSTHPSPGNRAEVLKQIITENWPNGVPAGLTP
jgi:predicted Zn-dependent protease